MSKSLKIAVIGGGAAGFFAAINCKINYPQHHVTIYEKSKKTLSRSKFLVEEDVMLRIPHFQFQN